MPPRMLVCGHLLLGSPAQPRRRLPHPGNVVQPCFFRAARLVTTDEVLTEVLNWFAGVIRAIAGG